MQIPKRGFKGKIFYNSWGYDMTINDFVKVVSETDKTVMVVKMGKKVVGGEAGYTGLEVPVRLPKSNPFRLKKSINNYDNSSKIELRGSDKSKNSSREESVSWWLWDGTPQRFNYMD